MVQVDNARAYQQPSEVVVAALRSDGVAFRGAHCLVVALARPTPAGIADPEGRRPLGAHVVTPIRSPRS
jgi:hypothetical protein